MVDRDRNTDIVNRHPQTANRFEKITNYRSPQMQKCDIQEIDDSEDNHQTHKIYQIQNCGTVYMESSNAHSVRMENCSNNVPQVTCSLFYLSLFPSLAWLYLIIYSDHRPRIIGNETVLHSQSDSDPVSNGMWASESFIKHVDYVLLPLGLQNATGPPTAPTEIAPKSNASCSNGHLQTGPLSPSQSPHPISPSGDHAHHLEQLLDSSLATVAVIQFSGSTMADVLTPRAFDTIKALYALAALDGASSSAKPRENEIPTSSTFSDKGNDCPYLSNRSPSIPNSRLAVPPTVRMHGHVSITVDYVVLISWAGLVAVFCVVVFFYLPSLCERVVMK